MLTNQAISNEVFNLYVQYTLTFPLRTRLKRGFQDKFGGLSLIALWQNYAKMIVMILESSIELNILVIRTILLHEK